MITREELNEVENVIRDLQMALNFKESIENDEPFMLLPLAEPVTIILDKTKKTEINIKISELEAQLKTKLVKLA